MGYSSAMATLAMQDSKSKTLEEALDLLLTKEPYYRKKSKKSSKKEHTFDFDENYEEAVSEPVYNSFGQVAKVSLVSKSKSDNRKLSKKDSFEERLMDETVVLSISKILKSLTSISQYKDPSPTLTELSKQIKEIKFNYLGTCTGIHKYLASNTFFQQISDLRNRIYELIQKLLNMNLKTKVMDFKELEYVLLMSFEMRLIKTNHMETIMNGYSKYCTKVGIKADDNFMNTLDKNFIDASNSIHTGIFSGVSSQADDMKLMEDPILKDCTTLTNVNHSEIEESKENLQAKVAKNMIKGIKHSEKELCIVCMEKIREVVFLPCCHFLGCSDCSPKIGKCPMCTKKIEKNLKIFWS